LTNIKTYDTLCLSKGEKMNFMKEMTGKTTVMYAASVLARASGDESVLDGINLELVKKYQELNRAELSVLEAASGFPDDDALWNSVNALRKEVDRIGDMSADIEKGVL